MVDAAGAIFVIGGDDGDTYYHDVWASTDGGARAGLGRGVHSVGYSSGVLEWGTEGYCGVLRGYEGLGQ